jgi:hypothetical protein
VYALHLSRDLAYIVDVAPINSTLCNTFHHYCVKILLVLVSRIFFDYTLANSTMNTSKHLEFRALNNLTQLWPLA